MIDFLNENADLCTWVRQNVDGKRIEDGAIELVI